MRRAILMAMAALALAACGGAQQSSPPAHPAAPQPTKSAPVVPNLTDEQQIQNTIRSYNQALLNGDGAAACSKMTQAAQQPTRRQDGTFVNCPEIMGSVGSGLRQLLTTPAQQNAYVNPRFTGTQIGGLNAETAYDIGNGTFVRAQLNKDTGSWLIVSST